MEVQDNTAEVVIDQKSIFQARPGQPYPIRLIHFSNNMIIVGFVINVIPHAIIVLRPYNLEGLEREDGQMAQYELKPYLDQIVQYDPVTLTGTAFLSQNILSTSVPADHIIKNYTSIIQLKEFIAHNPEGEIKLRTPNKKRVH